MTTTWPTVRALLAVSVVATVAVACSTTPPPPLDAAILARPPAEELFDLSPLRVRIRNLPGQAARLLSPLWARVRESDRVAVQATLADLLAEERIAPAAKRLVADEVAANPELAEAALAWLRGPLGYEVKFAEATTWSGERSTEDLFFERYHEVREDRAPEVRMARIRRLVLASGAVDAALDVTHEVGLLVSRLVNRTRPGVTPLPLATLKETVRRERAKPDVRRVYESVVETGLLVRCRDLGLDELDSYISFAETEAGRWYHRVLSRALAGAVAEVGNELDPVFTRASASRYPSHAGAGDLESYAIELPSGRSVRFLVLARAGGEQIPTVVLRYETSLSFRSLGALRREAEEVWEHVRAEIEQGGARAAVLQATGAVDGWVFPSALSRSFAWRRDSEGRWRVVKDAEARFGALQRETLWSIPP